MIYIYNSFNIQIIIYLHIVFTSCISSKCLKLNNHAFSI